MIYSKKPINNNFIVAGYSTREHLLLDLDNTTLSKTLKLMQLIMNEYPKIGDCLIVLSSTHTYKQIWFHKPTPSLNLSRVGCCYHIVFDNRIGYNTCDHILKTLVGVGILKKIADKLRGLRRCMTLRVSPKVKQIGVDMCPIPLLLVMNASSKRNDNMIQRYLNCLRVAYSYFQPNQPPSPLPFQSQINNPQEYQPIQNPLLL